MAQAFERLARPIQKWVRAQGWQELRPIQSQAIQMFAEGESDLILAAATAGGKTEAAFLPLISQIFDSPREEGGFDLLYIGPLKALITDQAGRLEEICRETELPVVPWHGDVPGSVKKRAIDNPSGILLITPESLEALFIRRGPDIPRIFRTTRAIIIDELHTVLDSERGIQLRSLLTRMELETQRRIRRVGLSATLGDMEASFSYLRPDDPASVKLLQAEGGDAELMLQLRGYVSGEEDDDASSATAAVASHLFANLRGADNLVFAGSRQSVEIYADQLHKLCEEEHLPQEFYPHHANLSRDHRSFVERRLKDGSKPTTAICTSTLELGIDIGDITCVAQIDAPFSVASLRQRLGRSGRRIGTPAILRQYAIEARLAPESNYVDQLRLGLVRSVAMINLLLAGWCEPPKPHALHLSTLVHQILSVIAGHGGAYASHLFHILCQVGPFKKVSTTLFMDVLRALGDPASGLIEQADDGLLLLGRVGERLVEHYSFYAVFNTPEEYRIISGGKELGTLPIVNVMTSGMMLIFSGRRWVIQEIDDRDKVISVMPSKGGNPPKFGGSPGDIHDKVIEEMFKVLEGSGVPAYIDRKARELLEEARRNYNRIGFRKSPIVQLDERIFALATRVGTTKTSTLAHALRSAGFQVDLHDGFLTALSNGGSCHLRETLRHMAAGNEITLFGEEANLVFEKFHPYLTRELLKLDALSSKVDAGSLPDICKRLLSFGIFKEEA